MHTLLYPMTNVEMQVIETCYFFIKGNEFMEEFKYLIPEESIDAIMSNVSTLRGIENELRKTFVENQYLEVLMPSFEYVDLYNEMDIGIEEEKMFQYINYEGKRVALRTDFTVPLARLYSTQEEHGEKRYCYFGKVYRKEKRHKGRSSEFFQAGIELIGKDEKDGDKECLELVLKTLPLLKLKDIKIELGSAKFYKRICEMVDDERFIDILKKRDISAMKAFVQEKQFSSSFKQLLMKLPRCFGDMTVLEEVIPFIADTKLKESLLELQDLHNQLGNPKEMVFDLAMVPSMKYYTGIMMKGYSPYSADAIMHGGRYDLLLSHFKQDAPAIGFSYDLSHILKAIEKEGEAHD